MAKKNDGILSESEVKSQKQKYFFEVCVIICINSVLRCSFISFLFSNFVSEIKNGYCAENEKISSFYVDRSSSFVGSLLEVPENIRR